MYDVMIGSAVLLTVTDEGFAQRLTTDLRDAQKAGFLFQLDGQRIAAVPVERGPSVVRIDSPVWPDDSETIAVADDSDEG